MAVFSMLTIENHPVEGKLSILSQFTPKTPKNHHFHKISTLRQNINYVLARACYDNESCRGEVGPKRSQIKYISVLPIQPIF